MVSRPSIVLGMTIGASEAETFWTEFLRQLARRGVKLVNSDAHDGIKAAVSKVFSATWHRCRMHFMRNALAHAGKSGRRVVAAFIATGVTMATRRHGVGDRVRAERRRGREPALRSLLAAPASPIG